MTTAWALRISTQHAALLGPLRCKEGLSVLADGPSLWLRGEDHAALDTLAVRRLPTEGRYTVRADGGLIPVDHALPVGVVPEGAWVGLSQWMQLKAPKAQFAGQTGQRIALSLVRSADERRANLLLTTYRAVRQWAEGASQLRLSPLSVAVDREQQCVALRGEPLPPLPGDRYAVEAGVAVPAGFGFALPLTCTEVAGVVGLKPEQLAVFGPDGGWSLLPEDCFVAATRATLRQIGRPTRGVSPEKDALC
ncbi:hypothetical protein OT109_09455 [Phycisphaeraceae bacterium D3-23]